MLIPVFLSVPSSLNERQLESYKIVLGELGHLGIEARTLGRTDYPTSYPLREILTLAKHCSGGVILGFSQFETKSGIWKNGTPFKESIQKGEVALFPTPWNHLEAGVLFSLGVPLLVFREVGISGGVFDNGVTDLFIHPMPNEKEDYQERKALRAVFQKWTSEVRTHYYGPT